MAASTLPVELLLQVFRHLDARSFFAARKVCRWWYVASQEPVTLRELLQTLPVSPPVTRNTLSPHELQGLSIEASRALMLDYSAHRELDSSDNSVIVPVPTNIQSGQPVSFASKARRMAVFDGSQIRLFDTSAEGPTLICQRPLQERLGKSLWLKTCPLNSCKIALASHGHLLALAFRSTIQVYDLSSAEGGCVINDCITTANDQVVSGVEFEQNDHLLRVHMNLKGNVVYLGSPPRNVESIAKTSFEHWSSGRGLMNVFLDSSMLAAGAEGQHNQSWLSGVQALRPSHDGYLFAGQKHGGGQSSRYAVVHARSRYDPVTRTVRIDHNSVTEIARLESFLSSLDFGTAGLARHDIGVWENMPSAHESCPKFSLTPDKKMLVLAEREKKRIWPSPMTEVFVYRLPSQGRIDGLLKREDHGAKKGTFPRHAVPAIPLCLGTTGGKVKDISMVHSATSMRSYRLTVVTNETVRSWRLDSV